VHPDRAASPRERRKARTRAEIQQHALRLFAEQGYQQTTVDQIAAAADVSPRTFFRYFRSKEDTVTFDRLDPELMRSLARQPADLDLLSALRAAVREVYATLDRLHNEQERQRMRLFVTEPELSSRLTESFSAGVDTLADAIAQRSRRSTDDLAVRAAAGAISGVMFAVFDRLITDGAPDWAETVDRALGELQAGLSL
jgi:AcrR family transcriptional regulator